MKRFLSVLLALTFVFSSCVFAAPTPLAAVETSDETSVVLSDEEVAQLMAVKTVKPGINLFTGTTAPLTGETTTTEALNALCDAASTGTTLSVSDDPYGEKGKVLHWYFPMGKHTRYPTLTFKYGGELFSLLGHDKIHFAFDVNKSVPGYDTADKYSNHVSFWIMNNSTGGGDVATSKELNPNSGWIHFDQLVTMTKSATTSKTPENFKFEAEVATDNTVDTHFYFDNLMAVPAYEFKFLSTDGEELNSIYQAFDANGNVITTYEPKAGVYGNYYVPSWSLTKGTSAVKEVALNNENVTFYATSMIPVITIEQDGYLVDEGSTATLTPVVSEDVTDVNIKLATAEWSVEDENVVTVSTNKDGSAVITAVGEGSTTVTLDVSGFVIEYDVTVVFPYTIEGSAFDGDGLATIESNASDYKAMVVRLKNATAGASYYLCYANSVGEHELSFTAPADGNVDCYIDLSEVANWQNSNYVDFFFDCTGATIETVKLYSQFDPTTTIEFNEKLALLSSIAQEATLSVNLKSNLLGIEVGECLWTVEDEDDLVSYAVNEDGSLKLRAKAGTGIVKVTATSSKDETLSISRDIYVNVDATKYGGFYDFLEAEKVEDAGIRACGGDTGNTKLSIVDGALYLNRPTSGDGYGGFENISDAGFSVPASMKYMVINVDNKTNWLKIYYKWDSVSHAEANTAYTTDSTSVKIDNEDGTYTYYLYLKNVPDTATIINGFMGQISGETTATINYMYFTSEAPDLSVIPAIGYTWDFKTTTFNNPSKGEHHFLSSYDGESVTVTKAFASLSEDGSAKAVPVGYSEVTLDGATVWKLTLNNSGSISPKDKPSGMKLKDYPYMWVKYKSTGTATLSLYLRDKDTTTDGNVSGTVWDNKAISFPASNEYVWKVIDLKANGFNACMNNDFSNMMYAFTGETVLDEVKYNEAGNYYYVVPPVKFKSSVTQTIDEITFANYDLFAQDDNTLPLDIVIALDATSTSITEDGGSVVITPTIYANQEISTKELSWSTDNGNVSINENKDGTVTVSAISNGEVIITATSVEDPSFKTSIKITVTGQRKKIAAYDFSYLAIGNSYCLHGYNKDYSIWLPAGALTRGMAASEPDLDYYHRVQYHLTNELNGTIVANRFASATLENAGEITDKVTTLEQVNVNIAKDEQYNNIKNYLINSAPNIITVQLSENFSSKVNEVESTEVAENFYNEVYGMIDRYRPEKSVVIVITPFNAGQRVNTIKKYAEKFGFYVADMSDINSYSKVPDKTSPEYNTYIEAAHPVTGEMTKFYRGDSSWKYNPYMAWAQYPAYDIYTTSGSEYNDGRAEFRTHPGDLGMDEIGKRVVEQCKIAVPGTLEAEYIYVPESIEITGADTITEQGGSIDLGVEVTLSDAADDVVWSIDDTKIASIDADGVLTAKHNGTVVVTAKSAYDASVVATKTITISGQALVFNLSYAAGTTDTVTGLPTTDVYANGEYTLSTVAPERNGYKFLGWALAEGGEVVKTVNVAKDTTVYAVWTLAESWHFDEDGNSEGLILGGFNIVIENGTASVLSYDEGVTIGNNSLLLDSNTFDKFNVKINLSGTSGDNNTMNLEVTSTKGKYTYSEAVPATGSMYEYSFDISDVAGTITGFILKPSAMECQVEVDWMEFRRTALAEDVHLDKVTVIDEYTVDLGGNIFTIDSLVVNEGGKVTFTNGTVVLANLENAGEVVFDCCVIYTGDEEIEGYVAIDAGDKASESNVRYAEVDGLQYKFEGNVYGFILAEGETKLVQIVEKATENTVLYSSKYFLVTNEGVKEIEGLADNTNNNENVSMRLDEYTGVRFKAYILNEAKSEEVEFKIQEYGFVIALERDLVNAGEQLTLDFHKIATGVAYVAGTDIDVINSIDVDKTVFTGVLYGIPENSYGVRLVSKTYTKIIVEGNEYVVYGEPVVASAYQIAKSLENDTTLSPEHKAVIDNIIDKAENGKDLGFDYGDLLSL